MQPHQRKKKWGSEVKLIKVDSHVEDGSTESLANDLADAAAKDARINGLRDTISISNCAYIYSKYCCGGNSRM